LRLSDKSSPDANPETAQEIDVIDTGQIFLSIVQLWWASMSIGIVPRAAAGLCLQRGLL
jgi:hypothetical protein